MEPKAKPILTVMHITAWLIFLGLCVRTGGILYTFFVSLVINPEGAKNLYEGLNLSELYNYSIWQYSVMLSVIVLITAMKALMFYLLIKVFSKINLIHPFSKEISSLISKIGYIALSAGILTAVANIYAEQLTKKGLVLPGLPKHLEGGGEFLLFAAVIFFIAQIFKRGIEIQTENELTV